MIKKAVGLTSLLLVSSSLAEADNVFTDDFSSLSNFSLEQEGKSIVSCSNSNFPLEKSPVLCYTFEENNLNTMRYSIVVEYQF